MPHPRFSGDQISELGEQIYSEELKSTVEVEENIGKIISIDIETHAYEIDDDIMVTGRRLLAAHPGAAIYGKRIGYNAVYAVGGSLVRTAE